MENHEALIGLNLVPGIGTIRLGNLLATFGTPQNILSAPEEKLQCVAGIGSSIARGIVSLKEEDIRAEIGLAERLGVKIITRGDAGYPFGLAHISDPPIVLYVRGSLEDRDVRAIGVVGSRKASFYGLSCSERFSGRLAEAGFTIVSGMARGVDTGAHRGALRAGGRTIAVLGSGFCSVYPAENSRLADTIAGQGAVISEFPMRTTPQRLNFPRRNRLISGLSLAVLVVEAARNSGALITADFALEQGKDVFAVPGNLDNPAAAGTNELIRQGAGIALSPEQLIAELGYPAGKSDVTCVDAERVGNRNLSERETVVYNILTRIPQELEDLYERLDLSFPLLYPALTALELKGLIRQLPGKRFCRT